jgi:hypothetical protein
MAGTESTPEAGNDRLLAKYLKRIIVGVMHLNNSEPPRTS